MCVVDRVHSFLWILLPALGYIPCILAGLPVPSPIVDSAQVPVWTSLVLVVVVLSTILAVTLARHYIRSPRRMPVDVEQRLLTEEMTMVDKPAPITLWDHRDQTCIRQSNDSACTLLLPNSTRTSISSPRLVPTTSSNESREEESSPVEKHSLRQLDDAVWASTENVLHNHLPSLKPSLQGSQPHIVACLPSRHAWAETSVAAVPLPEDVEHPCSVEQTPASSPSPSSPLSSFSLSQFQLSLPSPSPLSPPLRSQQQSHSPWPHTESSHTENWTLPPDSPQEQRNSMSTALPSPSLSSSVSSLSSMSCSSAASTASSASSASLADERITETATTSPINSPETSAGTDETNTSAPSTVPVEQEPAEPPVAQARPRSFLAQAACRRLDLSSETEHSQWLLQNTIQGPKPKPQEPIVQRSERRCRPLISASTAMRVNTASASSRVAPKHSSISSATRLRSSAPAATGRPPPTPNPSDRRTPSRPRSNLPAGTAPVATVPSASVTLRRSPSRSTHPTARLPPSPSKHTVSSTRTTDKRQVRTSLPASLASSASALRCTANKTEQQCIGQKFSTRRVQK